MRIPLDKQTEAIWGKYKLKGSKIEVEALAAGSVWGIHCVRLHRGAADPQGRSLLCRGGVASGAAWALAWPDAPRLAPAQSPESRAGRAWLSGSLGLRPHFGPVGPGVVMEFCPWLKGKDREM